MDSEENNLDRIVDELDYNQTRGIFVPPKEIVIDHVLEEWFGKIRNLDYTPLVDPNEIYFLLGRQNRGVGKKIKAGMKLLKKRLAVRYKLLRIKNSDNSSNITELDTLSIAQTISWAMQIPIEDILLPEYFYLKEEFSKEPPEERIRILFNAYEGSRWFERFKKQEKEKDRILPKLKLDQKLKRKDTSLLFGVPGSYKRRSPNGFLGHLYDKRFITFEDNPEEASLDDQVDVENFAYFIAHLYNKNIDEILEDSTSTKGYSKPTKKSSRSKKTSTRTKKATNSNRKKKVEPETPEYEPTPVVQDKQAEYKPDTEYDISEKLDIPDEPKISGEFQDHIDNILVEEPSDTEISGEFQDPIDNKPTKLKPLPESLKLIVNQIIAGEDPSDAKEDDDYQNYFDVITLREEFHESISKNGAFGPERLRQLMKSALEADNFISDSTFVNIFLGINGYKIDRRLHFKALEQKYGVKELEYQSASCLVIKSFLSITNPGSDDVVYDLRSGYGKLGFYGALATDAKFKGIEIIPERVEECNRIKEEFHPDNVDYLENLEFIQGNVLEKDFSDGNIFFLFNFNGNALPEVVERLRGIADKKDIKIVSYNPSNEYLEQQDWLQRMPAATLFGKNLALFESFSTPQIIIEDHPWPKYREATIKTKTEQFQVQ